jgi:hypothetical protein
MEEIAMPDITRKRSSKLWIGLEWLVVILPLTWGLTFTVRNAVKIFAPTAAAAPAANPATK